MLGASPGMLFLYSLTNNKRFMKKYLFAGLSALCSLMPLSAQHRADQQKLYDENSFSMILLGDPQGYTKYDINQPLSYDVFSAIFAQPTFYLVVILTTCSICVPLGLPTTSTS